MSNKTLVLVDGSSYLFRAYYGLPALTSPTGEPTGAIYGVVNMLKKLLKEYDTQHVAVIFDSKGKNFRHEIYPEYKANRAAMPDDLAEQIEPLHTIIRDLGIPLIKHQGIEADDIIGTIAKRAEAAGYECVISTGDKDFAQLVNDKITLVNTMTQSTMNSDGVIEKFGVTAEQIIDYLALVGDSVDNVPGIPKVGPKTAVKWLTQYKTIDNLVKHADEIKGKVGENLRDNLQQLDLSVDLVTIRCDMDIADKLEDMQLGAADDGALHNWYKKLGFKRWLTEVSGDAKPVTTSLDVTTAVIADADKLQNMLQQLVQQDYVAVRSYHNLNEEGERELFALAFAWNDKNSYFISIAEHVEFKKEICKALKDYSGTIVGYDLKEDIHNCGCDILIGKKIVDVMLQDYVTSNTNRMRSIVDLAKQNFGYDNLDAIELEKNKTILDLETPATFAGTEVVVVLQLYKHYAGEIVHDTWAERVLRRIDLPLVSVLADMEHAGVLLDCDLLQKQSKSLGVKLEKTQEAIFAISANEFNIDSPKQLQEVLFEQLGCPVIKKTPKGVPSTNEEVLSQLAADYPIAELILDYRGMRKLKNTYLDKLPEDVATDGRVHTTYNMTGTSTGRLSSNNPNLQNIPVRTLEGRKIRQAFIAEEGYSIVAADYSQVELRIMAHISGEPSLIAAFRQGLDIHAATAADIFGVDVANVTAEQRRRAKAVNFGLIYGMSAFGLAKQINVPRKDAQYYIDKYFEHYPTVLEYMNEVRERAAADGYVETIFGRRIYMPNIHNKNPMLRKAAERAAINAPMQGSAADIIKVAMIDIHKEMRSNNLPMRMLMQVHDELVFAVKDAALQEAQQLIKTKMEGAANLQVGLDVAIGVGANWDEAH